MSLLGAVQSSVSGLKAQSQSLTAISDNIANTSTVGYKAAAATFASYVTGGNSSGGYSSGGVSSKAVRNNAAQGTISDTTVSTNMALDGNGFFVVSSGSTTGGDIYYTRTGTFSANEEGYLVNTSGYYLLGIPIDSTTSTASITASSLEAVNISSFAGMAQATKSVNMKLNLPAEADVGDVYNSSMTVYDSLGVEHSVDLTFTKTASNAWEASFSSPVDSSGTTEGTLTGSPISLTFNTNGSLASVSSTSLSITGWTSGAEDTTLAMDFGTVGKSDGITQAASGGDTPEITITSITPDGFAYGAFTDVSVADDGTITAKFDNGGTQIIYKVPVATFANANGLTSLSGNIYRATPSSGLAVLNEAGSGGSATISGSALESSTVDISDEFSQMIIAQQAYTAASKVITTANDMMDTLVNVIR